ncbi:MAG TPA: serine/threonine-protein kinase [Thermomonas sp.]|nr:serine/threonine-protein kinase [Thermomonas sp.]
MNDDDTRSATNRWWLNPALAQLAFGTSTQRISASPPSAASMMERALLHGRMPGIDLDDPAQREFGDYELLELIGQGGMGMVYRARQRDLDREVAIKLLSTGALAPEEFVDNFRCEARHAANLQHPHIVVIYEMGEHAGLAFYAMQLVRGLSLAQLLAADETLSPRQAATFLRTVAEAVDYAHRLGVLHLDLKPGNLLIDGQGVPLVADFGLARRIEQVIGIGNDHVSGTPGYMAPEQAQLHGPPLSPATDVWGLGAILYELLTGTPPHEAGDPEATLLQLTEGEVRKPSQLKPVPADLEAICLKCLARHPQQRYLSARALADDLGRYLEGRAVSVRPLSAVQRAGRWARREPHLAAATALTLLALLAGVLATSLQAHRAERSADTARQHLWQQRIDEAADTIHEDSALDALPAMMLNLTEQEAAGASAAAALSRVRIGALLAEAPALIDVIATGDTIEAVALDPAGKWVATASAGGMLRSFDIGTGGQRWSADTRAATKNWPHHPLASLQVTGDGRFLIASGHARVEAPSAYAVDQLLVDATTGALLAPPPGRFDPPTSTSFSADARFVLVRSGDPARASTVVSRVLRTADWQPIEAIEPFGKQLALVASANGGVARHLEEERTVEIVSASGSGTRHRYRHAAASLQAWKFSDDGRHLALGYEDGHTVLLDVSSGKPTMLAPRFLAAVRFLSFSEGGAWLAASALDGSIQAWDLATGALLSTPLQLQGNLTFFMTRPAGSEAARLLLDRGKRALFAVNSSRAVLWQLPGTEAPATILLQRPSYPRQMQKNATAMLPQLGLMAVGSQDGALRLWRSRERLPLPGSGPPRVSGENNFAANARRAVIVATDRVTVLDAVSGSPVGPTLRHPEPVGFAVLTPDGGTVVTTSGARLYAHDTHSGRARFPPIALAANPNELLMSPRGDQLIVGHNGRDHDDNLEVLESYTLATGKRSGRIGLWPPERMLGFSGDGASVLAWHVQVVDTLDATTLRRRGPALWPDEPPRAPGKPATRPEIRTEGYFGNHQWVDAMVLADDGRSGWMLSAGKQNILQPMDATRGWIAPGWQLPSVGETLQWLPHGQVAVLLPEADAVKIYERDGRHRNLLVHGTNAHAGFALSGDATRLAIAVNRGVQLFDLASGTWLTPPIRVSSDRDEIHGLSIDAHGRHLLLRSREQRLWALHLDTERRPLPELTRLAALLHPDDTALVEAYAKPLSAADRAMLRAQDPGPPKVQWDMASAASIKAVGKPVVASRNDAARNVDLRQRCNVDLDASDQYISQELRLDRVFAPGRHRLLGIDYDIRCAVITSNDESQAGSAMRLPGRIAGIAIPQRAVATFHLLMTSGAQPRGGKAAPTATFELTYRDGSRVRLPILYRKQLWEWWTGSTEGGSRLAYLASGILDTNPSMYPPSFFEVRLANPHPEREIASVALEAVDGNRSQPVLLAITIDPAHAPVTPPHHALITPRATTFERQHGGGAQPCWPEPAPAMQPPGCGEVAAQ